MIPWQKLNLTQDMHQVHEDMKLVGLQLKSSDSALVDNI
jgi:hypothetical protein